MKYVKNAIIATGFLLIFISFVACTPSRTSEIWPNCTPESAELLHRFDTMIGSYDQKAVVKELYRLSLQHPEDEVLRWRTLICDAETRGGAEAISLQNQALALMDTTLYKYDYMRLQIVRANALYLNDLQQLYHILRTLLDYFTEIGDIGRQFQVCYYLGNVYDRLNQHERAYQVLMVPYKALEEHGRPEYRCYYVRRIAHQIYAMGQHQQAFDMLRKAESEPLVQRDTLLHIEILRSLCEFTTSLEEKDLISRRALQMAEKHPEGLQYTLCCKLRGKYFLRTHQLDSARHYLQPCIEPARIQQCDLPGRYDSYKVMAQLLAQLNQPDSAYYYMEKSNLTNDSLVGTLQNIISEEVIRSIADNEKQIQHMKVRSERERTILALLLNFALIVCVIFAFYSFYKWRKNSQEALRKIHENEKLKKEMGQRNEKYTTANIILADHKNVLNTISQIVSQDTPDSDKDVARQVKNVIRTHLTDETGWDTFSLEFENDYPGLLDLVRTTYPSLTPTDLKVCIYTFIHLRTHQISRLLNILPDSVKKSRQRVRRKLGISYLDVTIAEHLTQLYDQMKRGENDNDFTPNLI
ncbi:MAG: hypothetical protein IJL35_10530 [Bacteroidaceae bacterium]|nr:hypothetical protein [Bacteroidaceae bacterium]